MAKQRGGGTSPTQRERRDDAPRAKCGDRREGSDGFAGINMDESDAEEHRIAGHICAE
jgi:hypothetical protein